LEVTLAAVVAADEVKVVDPVVVVVVAVVVVAVPVEQLTSNRSARIRPGLTED
jgi:predicted Co/Zn/Cd cation transporter (cation efflux family)